MKAFKYCLLLFSIILSGCSAMQFPETYKHLDRKTFKHDLTVEINNQVFHGTGIANRASSYKVTVYPDERVDRIIYSTCHESQVIDKPKTNGWFKKSVTFTLNNVPGISDVNSCSLEIIVLNQASRQIAFALVEFLDQRPEINLPSTIKCNGEIKAYKDGVSICQASEGLVQEITFNEPVVQTGASKECDVMKAVKDKVFIYFMPQGKCTYYFSSQRKFYGKRVSHRLQTVGVTDMPVKD